jgi:hypothetical protein
MTTDEYIATLQQRLKTVRIEQEAYGAEPEPPSDLVDRRGYLDSLRTEEGALEMAIDYLLSRN